VNSNAKGLFDFHSVAASYDTWYKRSVGRFHDVAKKRTVALALPLAGLLGLFFVLDAFGTSFVLPEAVFSWEGHRSCNRADEACCRNQETTMRLASSQARKSRAE
jgi:hypothetical protein